MRGYVKAVKIVKVELGTIEVVHSNENSVNGDYVYDELCEQGQTTLRARTDTLRHFFVRSLFV